MTITDANTVFGFWPKRKLDASSDALLARMDAAGIERALTCSIRGWLYDFKEGNDETWKTCKEHGDRLVPVATINPSTYFGVQEEVERIVDMGTRVVRFFPTAQEWSVSQRHFGKLLEKLAETNLVLMLPSTEGVTAIANAVSGIPNNVLIESVRLYPHMAELMVVLQENPKLFVESHLIGGLDFVETLVQEVGEDRLVFGSGAPFNCIPSTTAPIVKSRVSDAVKEKIFSKNLFNLLEAKS